MKFKQFNIVGYPQGAFGIAEDARSLKKVFDALGFDSKYLLPTFREIIAYQKIDEDSTAVMNPGALNLFAVSPMDMMSLALSKNSNFIDDAGFSIGAWPWELPYWPKEFGEITNFVDEIWAQSEYVEKAFNSLGKVKVRKMPMLVSTQKPTARVRTKFNIPEGNFVFYTVIDGNSWVTRKNPAACIKAFKKAFGESNKDVSLVIKAMNTDLSGVIWDELIALATHDARVIIINQILQKSELINLVTSCDCFVSLHRSEGFGRNIAEAMLLGIPVIVSNFSGSTDFCNARTSFLVGGKKIPLKIGDYLFYEDQFWFDADIEEASIQMELVASQSRRRCEVAENGKKFIEAHYSLEAIVPQYRKAIYEITGD